MSTTQDQTSAGEESAETRLLSQWREWERRTGNDDSKLELYSDGSGVFDERDLFGPTHSFETLSELRAIWDNAPKPSSPLNQPKQNDD